MFVDASAILAILLNEKEAAMIVESMQRAHTLYFSPVVRFESIVRLASLKSGAGKPIDPNALDQAVLIIDQFARQYEIVMLPITEKESKISIDAYKRYGKGTGHKAQLNMGDCFSYACAKSTRLSLLYKGSDFIHTDVNHPT